MAIASKTVLATAICMVLGACSAQSDSPAAGDAKTETVARTPKADPGKILFMQCSACHSIDAGGATKTGPNLHAVVGRKAGSLDGYNYSKALSGSDLIWSREALDRFLASPSSTVPGTIMAFGGVPDAKKRQQLIDYLETASDNSAD